MSLSGLNSRETVTAYQLLLVIAEGIEELTKDPTILRKTIVEAYTLPEELQRKADEAKKVISDYQDLVSAQKSNIVEIESKLAAIEENKRSLDLMLVDINNKNLLLEKRDKKLKKEQEDFVAIKDAIQKDRNILESEKVKNKEFALSIEKRERDVDAHEALLKAKEEKLKEIVGGS